MKKTYIYIYYITNLINIFSIIFSFVGSGFGGGSGALAAQSAASAPLPLVKI